MRAEVHLGLGCLNSRSAILELVTIGIRHLESGGTGRKKKGGGSKNKTVMGLYRSLTELLFCFGELVEMQPLTDTTVLNLTSLAVAPFFVENISELQLNALRLITVIFKKYPKHRDLILYDILGSLSRLPNTKAARHTYRCCGGPFLPTELDSHTASAKGRKIV